MARAPKPLRRRLKWYLGILTFVGVYCWISVLATRWAFTSLGSCPQPCRDLGLEAASPEEKDKLAVYRPHCRPLRLELELYQPKAPIGTRYTLWYRISMTNVSCYKLGNLDASDFYQTAETAAMGYGRNWGRGLSLEITDPNGNSIEPVRYRGQSKFLYDGDNDAERALYEKFSLTDANSFFVLPPGESITTVPSTLHPLERVEAVDWSTGNHGERLIPRSIPPGAVVPPAGYRILDDRVFKRPGEYTIRAKFERKISAEPVLPYYHRIPNALLLGAAILNLYGLDFFPNVEWRLPHDYLVQVQSRELRFRVDRP